MLAMKNDHCFGQNHSTLFLLAVGELIGWVTLYHLYHSPAGIDGITKNNGPEIFRVVPVQYFPQQHDFVRSLALLAYVAHVG